MTLPRRHFWKMSGSGNDFVFFDCMTEPAGPLVSAEVIARLCERRTGIGADGVVVLEPHETQAFCMRYFNRDGSLAEMCGNAALCSVRLAYERGIAQGEAVTFQTVSGPVTGRLRRGRPELAMVPVTALAADATISRAAGESRMGFARVGVPHLVIEVDDLAAVDVVSRGRSLRYDASFSDGANVNFVARGADGRWSLRTYERGVEDETLACGTGAVATAALLARWGRIEGEVALITASGCPLEVTLGASNAPTESPPMLRGEGRIVFEGELGEL